MNNDTIDPKFIKPGTLLGYKDTFVNTFVIIVGYVGTDLIIWYDPALNSFGTQSRTFWNKNIYHSIGL